MGWLRDLFAPYTPPAKPEPVGPHWSRIWPWPQGSVSPSHPEISTTSTKMINAVGKAHVGGDCSANKEISKLLNEIENDETLKLTRELSVGQRLQNKARTHCYTIAEIDRGEAMIKFRGLEHFGWKNVEDYVPFDASKFVLVQHLA